MLFTSAAMNEIPRSPTVVSEAGCNLSLIELCMMICDILCMIALVRIAWLGVIGMHEINWIEIRLIIYMNDHDE